jgi:hypothetical protein
MTECVGEKRYRLVGDGCHSKVTGAVGGGSVPLRQAGPEVGSAGSGSGEGGAGRLHPDEVAGTPRRLRRGLRDTRLPWRWWWSLWSELAERLTPRLV